MKRFFRVKREVVWGKGGGGGGGGGRGYHFWDLQTVFFLKNNAFQTIFFITFCYENNFFTTLFEINSSCACIHMKVSSE